MARPVRPGVPRPALRVAAVAVRPAQPAVRAATALRTRWALTGRAVPRAWAKKLTRSSSSIQRTSTTSASPRAPGGSAATASRVLALERRATAVHEVAVAVGALAQLVEPDPHALEVAAQVAQAGRARWRPRTPAAPAARTWARMSSTAGLQRGRPGGRRGGPRAPPPRPPGRPPGPPRRRPAAPGGRGPPPPRRAKPVVVPRRAALGGHDAVGGRGDAVVGQVGDARPYAGAAARAGTARSRRSASRRAAGTARSSRRRVPARIARAWSAGRRHAPARRRSRPRRPAPGSRARAARRRRRRPCGAASPTSQAVRPRRSIAGRGVGHAPGAPGRPGAAAGRRGRGPLATSFADAVLDPEPHAQVGRAPGRGRSRAAATASPGERGQPPGQHVEQRPVGGPMPRQRLAGPVGRRHQVPAHGLGQRADQGGHELEPVAGHLPVEPVGLDLVEHGQGHVHGHAVVGGARAERVGHVEGEVALAPRGGEGVAVDRRRRPGRRGRRG